MRSYRAAAIGVSAGGLEALSAVLPELPRDRMAPVLVVQHRTEDAGDFLAAHLDSVSRVRVKEAEDKEPARAGVVYLAPAGYHLYVEADRSLGLSLDPRVHGSRPSIDELFFSAADAFGDALVGVVLTGASADGARGLRAIQERGGLTVVQDPASARAGTMPAAALAAVDADHVLRLVEIGPFLAGLPWTSDGTDESRPRPTRPFPRSRRSP